MEQKTTWMSCLITGTSIIILSVLFSCGREISEPIKTVNYIYINNTGMDLVMEVVPGLFYFDNFTKRIGDSLVIRFNNDKCLFYAKNKLDKIFRIEEYDNYSKELLEKSTYTLYYTFDSDDLAVAKDCN